VGSMRMCFVFLLTIKKKCLLNNKVITQNVSTTP